MNKLKAAVIGCGRIGTYTRPELRISLPDGSLPVNHAEAILANEKLQLIALCDINDENMMRASKTYGVAYWFEDISEVLHLKSQALNAYQSEMRKWLHSRSIQAVESLAKWRGASVGCEAASVRIESGFGWRGVAP